MKSFMTLQYSDNFQMPSDFVCMYKLTENNSFQLQNKVYLLSADIFDPFSNQSVDFV